MEELYLTEIDIERYFRDADTFISKYKDILSCYDRIVAVSRGGLVLSQLLSYKLGIKDIHVLCLSTYGEEETKLVNPFDFTLITPKTLVVDDLVDSGATYKFIANQLGEGSNFTMVALYNKGTTYPNLLTLKKVRGWVVFNWDSNFIGRRRWWSSES